MFLTAKSIDTLAHYLFFQMLEFWLSFHVCCHKGRTFFERVASVMDLMLWISYARLHIVDCGTDAKTNKQMQKGQRVQQESINIRWLPNAGTNLESIILEFTMICV